MADMKIVEGATKCDYIVLFEGYFLDRCYFDGGGNGRVFCEEGEVV